MKELGAVLDVSLPQPGGRLLEWQAVVIGGGVINGVGLVGAWPDERVEAVLKERPELRERWKQALDQYCEFRQSDPQTFDPPEIVAKIRQAFLDGRHRLHQRHGWQRFSLRQAAGELLCDGVRFITRHVADHRSGALQRAAGSSTRWNRRGLPR